jgi:hypothetical protein
VQVGLFPLPTFLSVLLLTFLLGSFLAAGVLKGTINIQGNAGWQIPYGLQWMWIPPLFLVAWFAPESPWYLIRRGKVDEAEKSLRRLARPGHYTEQTMRETLALMKHTNEMEKMEAKNASYADCFRGENKRRTMIVSMAWLIQIFNGQSITNYAATMLRAIGMSANDAFSYTMGIQSVNIFATAIAIALMGLLPLRLGIHRSLYACRWYLGLCHQIRLAGCHPRGCVSHLRPDCVQDLARPNNLRYSGRDGVVSRSRPDHRHRSCALRLRPDRCPAAQSAHAQQRPYCVELGCEDWHVLLWLLPDLGDLDLLLPARDQGSKLCRDRLPFQEEDACAQVPRCRGRP